jgi:TatA/E family protein of Tat protein translocase
LFGIGGWDFLIIALFALLLFGPDKLPQFARTIGRLVRDFKKYQDLMESTIRSEIYASDEEKKDPFEKGKEFREKVEADKKAGAEEPPEDATPEPAEEIDPDSPFARFKTEEEIAAEEAAEDELTQTEAREALAAEGIELDEGEEGGGSGS